MVAVFKFLNPFRRQHWLKGLTVLILIVAVLVGIATYAALTESPWLGSDQTQRVKQIFWLLYIDVGLLLFLALIIGWRSYLVWRRRRRNLLGSKLHLQLVAIFSVLAALPALIMAIFAIVFIQFSVQAWFGERISAAVSESKIVAQAYLQEHQNAIRADILGMANDLNRESPRLITHPAVLDDFLDAQTQLRNLSEAILINSDKDIVARGGLSFSIAFLPNDFSQKMQQADNGEVVLFVGEQEDRVRALIKLDNYFDTYLFVGRLVDEKVLDHITATNQAVDEYNQLERRQGRLKTAMTLIFILVALLLLMVAIWAGLTLAERLVLPILRLVGAAEKIRDGDLTVRVEEDKFENELTILARAFNRMTDQLNNQRQDLVQVNQQLDERRRFIETVLSGVNAGVMGIDTDGTVRIANESAQRLLKRDGQSLIGQTLASIAPEMETIRRALRRKQTHEIETQIALSSLDATQPPDWIVRMSADYRHETIQGYVATFDDISPLVDAQKKAAWSDVARRVAHEIKNPLTPIQLSAERLKKRYSPQITEGRETFDLCTDTITRQVDDIRRMVDEFAEFARLPVARKQPENLVTLCQDVVVLFQQSHHTISFVTDYPAHPITLAIDRQQIRQAVINLVKNAVEALQDDPAQTQPQITVAITQKTTSVTIAVADNGPGWPADLMTQLFDPYITTKDHGTGLGLAIVAKIVDEHGGALNVTAADPRGASIQITLPIIQGA